MKKSGEEMHENFERKAEFYLEKYPSQMEALQSAPFKGIRSVGLQDIWAVGQMLEQFEAYAQWMQEEGSAADLGTLPNIALDIITAAYGASVIPLIASVQPIEEEHGTVYFKTLKAMDTRGNVAAGQKINDPRAVPAVYPQGYAGEVVTVAVGNTVDTQTVYSGQAAKLPVRPNSVVLGIATTVPVTCTDDGQGNILGVGAAGSIDYTTGVWSITLTANPGVGKAITLQYGTSFEESGDIPQINLVTESTSVNAEIFVLGAQLGIFKAYAMKKRFGAIGEDEMAQDLTNALTAEIGNAAIARLVAACPASGLTWDRTPPNVAVAWVLHKQGLSDRLTDMEANMLTQVGRGQINTIVAGSTAASLLAQQNGFVKQQVTASGPAIYGTLPNGITVIRAPTVASAKMYGTFRGTSYFDAPLVYAPYMPLFVTQQQLTTNPLKKQSVAAVWAAIKMVIPNFVTDLTILNP